MDDQDAAALKTLHDDFLVAFRSNDQQALGAFYTDAAVVVPPRGGMLMGRDEIVAFWVNAERIQDLRFEPKAVERLGADVMREAGLLEIMIRGQDREIRINPARYVSVWSKTEDGWKLDSSIWTLSNPGGVGQGGPMRQGGRGQGGGRGQEGRQDDGGQGSGGRGQGGGRGPGGGPGRQGGGPGGGRGRGGGGYGQRGGGRGGSGGGRGQGGSRHGNGGGGPGGGFGPRSREQRANQDAPMIPRVD